MVAACGGDAPAAEIRPPYPVWPENWAAVEVFEAAQTQWRTAGMAGVATGLDYAGLRATCAFLQVRPSRDLLDRLRVLEGTALEILNRKR